MKFSLSSLRALPWLEKVWFVVFIAAAFLPFIGTLTLYRDDWYYIVDATYGGASIFHSMFDIDRPLRGYLFEWLYNIFGQNPLPYHLNVLGWRIVAGFGAMWLFRLLWPGQRLATWWMAALFALYPGYLWWPGGVEYTPMMISAALQVLSFALSLAAWKAPRFWQRLALGLAAILTGWACLGLVDYAIGMELLRLACFLLMAQPGNYPIKLSLWTALRRWSVYAIVPLGFLLWHSYFFNSARPDTNLAVQVGKLFQSPVNTGLWWFVRWVQSSFNTAIMAWGEPLGIAWQGLRLREILISLGCGLLGSGLAWPMLRHSHFEEGSNVWLTRVLGVGCLGVFGGVLPIIVANRSVQFERYSHYALPASLGAAMIICGFVGFIASARLRRVALMGITGLAFIIHAAWAQQVIAEEKEIANFWWQMSWRAPDFKPGTTFVINYPTIRYGEDQDIAWGPANYIYFGGMLEEDEKVYYLFPVLSQTHPSTLNVLAGQNYLWEYRSHKAEIRIYQLLIVSQPSLGSCIHVIDGEQPWYSIEETEQIVLLGPSSKPEMILTDVQPHRPDERLFGPEPNHGWCYYFQQADLAFQQQKWESVAFLAEEALQKNLRPVDRSEWMPFLIAYVILDRQETIAEIATRINDFPYLKQQACLLLTNLPEKGFSLSVERQAQINDLFCSASMPPE